MTRDQLGNPGRQGASTSPRDRLRGRQGFTLVFYALAMLVMLGFVGLVVDVGYLYTEKAQTQLFSDMIALTTLASTGTSATGMTTAQQIAYIQSFVKTQNVAVGLPQDYWPQVLTTVSADGRNVVQLTLNKPMLLNTFFLNLFGMPAVTVGIESIAVRDCISKVVQQKKPGNLNFFGCNLIQMQGSPDLKAMTFDSRGVFNNNVQSDSLFGGSNSTVQSQGNVYVGGDMFSAGVFGFTGNATTWNGTYQSANISGSPGAGNYTAINQAYPPIIVPPAVPNATTATNDNNLVQGATSAFTNGTSYVLDNGGGGPGAITIPAGARIYATQINLKNLTLTITGDPRPPPTGAGPVTFNLDAQFSNALSGPAAQNCIYFGDQDVMADYPTGTASVTNMRPYYLDFIGFNPPSSCCPTCPGGPLMIFKHDSGFGEIYAPGFQVEIHSNPNFYGNIVADVIQTQGSPDIWADTTHGFGLPTVPTPNNCNVLSRVHLIN